jgi:hypothetical protein
MQHPVDHGEQCRVYRKHSEKPWVGFKQKSKRISFVIMKLTDNKLSLYSCGDL